MPSAANETFNPEYYTNQPVVDASEPSPYSDTPAPKVVGNVSPLDPQLFSTVNEFVAELVKGERSAKYSPIEVAQWLEAAAEPAASYLSEAEVQFLEKKSPEFRRATIDLRIHIGVGRFFAAKFRSGVLYAAYEQAGDRNALHEALKQYRQARDIWHNMTESVKDAYVSDITFGTAPHQRGNWLDRLPGIDQDIAEMQKRLDTAPTTAESPKPISIHDLTAPKKRESINVRHAPAAGFRPGQPLEITVVIPQSAQPSLAIRLYFRHVNQAERYQSAQMHNKGSIFSSVIPAEYTNSNYPLQYYFELRSAANTPWLFPGLGPQLLTQPYFVVRPAL